MAVELPALVIRGRPNSHSVMTAGNAQWWLDAKVETVDLTFFVRALFKPAIMIALDENVIPVELLDVMLYALPAKQGKVSDMDSDVRSGDFGIKSRY